MSTNKVSLFIFLLLFLFQRPLHAEDHGHNMSSVDCNFDKGVCSKTLKSAGLRVILDINPKPVASMSELQFSVMIYKDTTAVTNAEVVVDLSMPGMYMGKNQIFLKSAEDNKYEGTGVIPVCASGSKTWMAEVKVIMDNVIYSAAYTFAVR